MANHSSILVLLFLVVAGAAAAAAPTAYDMLAEYGFPRGILPAGVEDYALHPDGSFEVSLPGGGGGKCEIYVAGYALRYSGRVRGKVRSMAIEKLEGVSVKVAAIKWVGIDDVKRDGDRLVFDAGMGLLSKSFAVANFADSPRCKPLPE